MKRPVVVKLGSSLVVSPHGRARRSLLAARAAEIAAVVGAGTPVCLVSSGAIALGLRRLGLERRPSSLPQLQAASALGQAALQRAWQDAFRPHGIEAAQILLTSAEVAERRAYLNVRNALGALFSLGAVPVVNENDATATDEIAFGDNDALAAQVAVLLKARLLVLLTAVPGVLAEGVVIEDGAAAREAVFGPGSALGRGGMESKVAAAELAAGAGIATVIADGAREGVLAEALSGRGTGRVSPRRARHPRSSSGSGTGSGSPAVFTSTRARGARSSWAARACSPSASSRPRAASAPATASSSSAPTASRSRAASPRWTRPSWPAAR